MFKYFMLEYSIQNMKEETIWWYDGGWRLFSQLIYAQLFYNYNLGSLNITN